MTEHQNVTLSLPKPLLRKFRVYAAERNQSMSSLLTEEIRKLVPPGASMSQFALRWILMFDAVSCAIPGGKRPEQVADNCNASDLPPLTPGQMAAVKLIYDAKIKPLVQNRW